MSTKSVAAKLLIKQDTTLWLSQAYHLDRVGELPGGVTLAGGPGSATTALVFADGAADLRASLARHRQQLAAPKNLWVVYPKKNRADINRDSLWPILGEYGLRPITQVAVDDVWSALRFRALAPGEQFTSGKT